MFRYISLSLQPLLIRTYYMEKRNLSFGQLFNLSFGFFGVQIAYALQSANISRIFATLGADPHQLSFFWVLPPLMGMIVQPLIGKYSDKTWCKLGRRKPYLLVGALIAVAVMMLLPNVAGFGLVTTPGFLALSQVLWFGVFSLIFLDTSINIAMQPFKMMVGDMVNEEQKGLAYSIQSWLCNAGSLVGYLLPFAFAAIGVAGVAPAGEIPDSVKWSFYVGAGILILCVLYTFFAVNELNPAEYAAFHGINEKENVEKKEEPSFIKLLINAPSTFWTVGLVQFFCWAAFLYMWSYTTGAVAKTSFDTPDGIVIKSYTMEGNNVEHTFITDLDGKYLVKKNVIQHDSIMSVEDVQALLVVPGTNLLVSNMSGLVVQDGDTIECLTDAKPIVVAENAQLETKIDMDTASKSYQKAGDWVGVLFAIQAIGAIIWASFLAKFRRRKFAYALSLLLGAVGFISVMFISNQYVLFGSFLLIGAAWAAMLALPFTILTNSLKGENMGYYLGLFNCTICLPQIIAALVGGLILKYICAGAQAGMLVVSGVLLILGAISVIAIKEKN